MILVSLNLGKAIKYGQIRLRIFFKNGNAILAAEVDDFVFIIGLVFRYCYLGWFNWTPRIIYGGSC